MDIQILSDKILLEERKDVLRWHLYGKLLQYGIKPFENDIDILLELYEFGGYNNSEEQISFIKLCLDKNLRKCAQSVRNTISKYIKLKVLDKPKNRILKFNDKYFPKISCDKLILQPMISHSN